jgi:cysteine-rich repeat protein
MRHVVSCRLVGAVALLGCGARPIGAGNGSSAGDTTADGTHDDGGDGTGGAGTTGTSATTETGGPPDTSGGQTPGTTTSEGFCGDGSVDPGEECDDGNTDSYDGCESDCTLSVGVRNASSGYHHTCAVSFAGAVRCWGDNPFGQLGYGHTESVGDDEVASAAGDVEVGAMAVQVAAGGYHTCVLLDGGAVKCWGEGLRGQLGYGNTDDLGDDETPASVPTVELDLPAVQIVAGHRHSCVLLVNGSVRCWGTNFAGELGLGHQEYVGDDEVPVDVEPVRLGEAAVQLSAGDNHTCAVLAGGVLRCWGRNSYGELGLGYIEYVGDDETPEDVPPVDVGGAVTMVSAGAMHTCALLAAGTVRCWGFAHSGRLGYGNVISIGDDEPAGAGGDVAIGGVATKVTAGGAHSCVVFADGGLRCWGRGVYGKLGYGNEDWIGDDELPTSVGLVPVGAEVLRVVAGRSHTCARVAQNRLRCWGFNAWGQLGYGHTNDIGDNEFPETAGDVPVF